MKKTGFRFLTGVMVLLLAAFLAGCGGGGGDDDVIVTPPVTPDGTFTRTVVLATNVTSSNAFSTVPEIRYQYLYKAGDMDGSGNIKSISFRHAAGEAVDVTCPSVTIKMGHTNWSNLTDTYANNMGIAPFHTVLDKAVTIPAGLAGEYFEIPLENEFHYDGIFNLVVEIIRTGACTGTAELRAGTPAAAYDSFLYAYDSAALTGALLQYLPNTEFVFSGGTEALDYTDSGAGNTIPFNTGASPQRAQMLYPASLVNGSGLITGIAVRSQNAVIIDSLGTVTVKMGHTTLSELTNTYADNYTGTPVTVTNAMIYNVPAGISAGEYIWIPVTKGFKYNGKDNLVVELQVGSWSAGQNISVSGETIGTNTRLRGNGDTGTLDGWGYHTKFRFRGATMDVHTGVSTTGPFPFNGTDSNQSQVMYKPLELGTEGTITKLALRYVGLGNSVADTYPAFKVIMGHTTRDVLDPLDTFTSNMDGAKTVFDGTFDYPAGLKPGDWVEVPLSAPFAYDPSRNLVVYFTSDVGTFTHEIAATLNATRYPGRYLFQFDNTSVMPFGGSDGLPDIRFWLK